VSQAESVSCEQCSRFQKMERDDIKYHHTREKTMTIRPTSTKSGINTLTNVRFAILVACLGWYASKPIGSKLLSHGTALPISWDDRVSHAEVDFTNDSLKAKREFVGRNISKMKKCSIFLTLTTRNFF
jgi:hypothetical protein